ncbi:MAG: hypothetical protein FJ356_04470 [Thaumarchaeota archaeon]|nr:hypothetical protein [Nitrososphaerota archaeon]
MDATRYFHAILISLYFAGIIFLGLRLLESGTDTISYNVVLSSITILIYSGVIFLTDKFLKKISELQRLLTPITILIGIFAPALVLPSAYVQIIFPVSQYYFYVIIYLGLTIGTLFVYHELWTKSIPIFDDNNKKIEYIKQEIRLLIEFMRGGLFLLAAALFSVVYAQSFQGAVSKDEMLLIVFTVTGFIALFLAPLYCVYQKRLKILSQ